MKLTLSRLYRRRMRLHCDPASLRCRRKLAAPRLTWRQWLLAWLGLGDRPRPGVCAVCRRVRVIQGNVCARCTDLRRWNAMPRRGAGL